MTLDIIANFLNTVLCIDNSLLLGFDLFRQRIVLTIVSNLKLLLLILLNEQFRLLDIHLGAALRYFVFRLLLFQLFNPRLKAFLLILKVPNLVRQITSQLLDLVDPAVNVLKTDQRSKLLTDTCFLNCWHSLLSLVVWFPFSVIAIEDNGTVG